MTNPRRVKAPDLHRMQVCAGGALLYAVVAGMCLLFGTDPPWIFTVLIVLLVFGAYREVRRYDRATKWSHAPEKERIP